jgi:hypothetical protein
MRSRLFLGLIIVTLVTATALTSVVSRITNGSAVTHSVVLNPPASRPDAGQKQDPDEIVDGAKNPEKIPDRLAYTLLLRFLANRKTALEKNAARSYLRLIFGCSTCPGASSTKAERMASEANIEKFLAIARDFEAQVQPLDDEARQTRGTGPQYLSETSRAKLKQLQANKEEMVSRLIATFHSRLGQEAAGKLHEFVTQKFKRKVKINLATQKIADGTPAVS